MRLRTILLGDYGLLLAAVVVLAAAQTTEEEVDFTRFAHTAVDVGMGATHNSGTCLR